MGAHIEPLLNALASNVHISPQFQPLNANPHFKRAVQLAVDRAVREVCSSSLSLG
jgi:CCR4-NOT transcription complex subunit 1